MLHVVLVFMYIFSFRIPFLYDSTMLVGLLLIGKAFINRNYANKIASVLFSTRIVRLLVCGFAIIIWGLICQLVNLSNDFNYLKTFIHLMISLVIGFMLVAVYLEENRTDKIINDIIMAFMVQTAFQWFFFLFPSISLHFNVLRNEDIAARNIIYSGYRGLAISSYGFFGLSACYALVILLYASEYNTLFRSKIINAMGFVFLASGTFFAGRTGYLGLVFIPLLIMKKVDFKMVGRLLLIACIVSISIFCFWRLANEVDMFRHLYRFTFEPVLNYLNGNGFTATSNDSLLSMYDRKISFSTFFIGDGKYFIDGISYQHVDVGYLRKIFYFGIIGVFLSLMIQRRIVGKTINRRLGILIILMMMVLELKGETFGMLISINSMTLLASYCTYQIEDKYNIVQI